MEAATLLLLAVLNVIQTQPQTNIAPDGHFDLRLQQTSLSIRETTPGHTTKEQQHQIEENNNGSIIRSPFSISNKNEQ